MRPLDLFPDSGNMAQFSKDFFPPDFRDWALYWTRCSSPFTSRCGERSWRSFAPSPDGLMSAENIVSAWIYQPMRRLMDACRAINEMVFAMLFIVAWDWVRLPGCWRSGSTLPALWPNFLPRR